MERREPNYNVCFRTTLTAIISATDVAAPGLVNVTVSTPAPGGGVSNALTFQIQNPAPTLSALSPNSATAGGSSFVLTLPEPISSRRRRNERQPAPDELSVPDAFNHFGVRTIRHLHVFTVANPSPGGGTSNALPFTITGIPQLSISAATATRSGGVTVTFTLKNVGTAIAAAGKITIAKLDTTGTTTTLPLSIGDLAAGATTGTLKVTFPNTLAAGSRVFTITVTASGKSLSASKQITVP